MPWPVHPTGFFGARGDNDTYKIERSLRFNSADSAYLNRTPASAGNRNTWTWSGWVKRAKLGTSQVLFQAGTASSPYETGITFPSGGGETDTLRVDINGNSVGIGGKVVTSALFRDTSAWYHIVLRVDLTESISTDRVKIYVNGVLQTSTATNPSNFNTTNSTQVNNNVAHAIGSNSFATGNLADYYLTEINFIDGQALTPSSFGETDAITGRWKAKAYSGTYGTNGFYLKFADNSGTTATTLGKDSSGNGNNWTPNNFSVTAGADNDSLLDSPTNNGTSGNYCTLNSLAYSEASVSFSEGNLRATVASGNMQVIGTMPFSGKTYIEYTALSSNNGQIVFSPDSNAGQTMYFNLTNRGIILNDGTSSVSGSVSFTINSGSLFSWTTNDIIGVAYDTATNVVILTKNGGSSVNITVNGIGASQVFPLYTNRTSASATTVLLNTGQRDFNTAAPTGFKALCTTNLPTPTIKKPSSYMDVVTYTGTGSALTPTSSLGFPPDLVWIKGRSGATDHALYDAVRGAEKRLESNNTDAEVISDSGVTAFNSNGFTLGTLAQVNTNTATYVAWAWDEAPIAGMDIVSYTGTGTATTIAHNLGVKPSMIIVKNRTDAGTNWPVYHKSVTGGGATNVPYLESTSAYFTRSGPFNNTEPTASVFSVGGSPQTDWVNTNKSGSSFIAYLFAEVEGFSKFGSYTGNGSSDGPFVFTGMRSRFLMFKRTDSTGNWFIYDTARKTFNTMNEWLLANTSDVENSSSTWEIDIISNGFKIRNDGAFSNASGGTYIFAAFAESPFKYARAR